MFLNLTYHFNLNYDRLVLQTINLDGLDNSPQMSTACGRPQFSIAQVRSTPETLFI